MGDQMFHSSVWALARAQHGVIARRQLLALSYSEKGIKHRVGIGRLHPLTAGSTRSGAPS